MTLFAGDSILSDRPAGAETIMPSSLEAMHATWARDNDERAFIMVRLAEETDVIKGYVEPVSGQLLDYLKKHPQVMASHVDSLRAELHGLGHSRLVILAFGRATYSLLERHLDRGDYSQLVQLTHYSHRRRRTTEPRSTSRCRCMGERLPIE